MKYSDEEQKTITYYDNYAAQWAQANGDSDDTTFWKNEMEIFHEFLSAGSVLEIGSGTGRDAKALIELGYAYTGTDVSKGLLKLAQARNPQAVFLLQSVYELSLHQKFDGFWTASTLLHIPKKKINEALQRIISHVKPGAIGFISLKQGEGEKIDDSTGRFFSYYSLNEFKNILHDNDFTVLKSGIKSNSAKSWIMFWVKAGDGPKVVIE